MNKWININNEKPIVGQEVLFCNNSGKDFLFTTFGLYLGDKFSIKFYSYQGKSYNATHWMSLPEPPKYE
jgi:Protein of unknown function (DUF551)